MRIDYCDSPLCRLLVLIVALLLSTVTTTASAATTVELSIKIGYLEWIQPRPPLLSNVLPEPEDSGLQGARLGLQDNNAGGRFLGHRYQLLEHRSEQLQPLLDQAAQWQRDGVQLLIVNLPADALLQLANPFTDQQLLLFNIGAPDNALRRQQCLSNTLHTLPSRAMLTDALAQWMTSKKLKNWLLVHGQADLDYTASLRRSAKRFGSRIVETKAWSFNTDLRRAAQREVPLFTQGHDYDAVVVADELGDFGEYLLYNTWQPRPVVGTQGLTPVAWHRVVEQWGAAQLQRRFQTLAKRWMNSTDYAGWVALRSIGEAVSALNQTDAQALRQHLLSEQFQLAGFKGRKLSYRPWNGQLRQPIPLVHPRALVSQSPQEGFLHPLSELDTLGFDRAESHCQNLIAGVTK
ncbi:MAG: ABC transporter substrate-binding protein [Halopseudomonas sp.]